MPEHASEADDVDALQLLVMQLATAHATVGEAHRVIVGLRPTVLDDLGLAKALQLQVSALQIEDWEVSYEENLADVRLTAALETALFRIGQGDQDHA
jgi:signal transduction histidine kinase